MAAEVVGTAFVRIRALTAGLNKDIKKGVEKAVKDADLSKASKQLGQSFSDSTSEEIGKGLKKKVENIDLDGAPAGKHFADSAGKQITTGLEKSVSDVDFGPAGERGGKHFATSFSASSEKEVRANFAGNTWTNLGEKMGGRVSDGFRREFSTGTALAKIDKRWAPKVVRNTSDDFADLFDDESDSFGNTLSRFFSKAFDKALPNFRKSSGKAASDAGKSFGDRLVEHLKTAIARLIPILTPTIASIASFLVQYIVLIAGQVSLLIEAAAGGLVALAGAGAAVGLAILPIMAAFKVQSPALERFKKTTEGVGKAWKQFGIATQKTLLPALAQAATSTKKLIPIWSDYGEAVGTVAGAHALMLSNIISGEEGQRRFRAIFAGSIPILDDFFAVITDIGDILSNLFIKSLPVAQQFSDILVEMVERWKDLVQVGTDDGTIAATFQDWFDKSRLVFGAFGDLFAALWDIIQIGSTSSVPLFENFATWAQDFRDFTSSIAGENKIKQVFEDAIEVGHAFNELVIDIGRRIGGGIFEAGGNEGLIIFFDTLRTEVVPFLDGVLRPLIDELGPQLTAFFVAFTDVLVALGETNTLQVTVAILTDFTKVLTALLNIPGMDKFAGLLLGIATALGALNLILPNFITKPLEKFLGFLGKLAGKALLAGLATLGDVLLGLASAVGVVFGGGALLGGAVIIGIIAAIAGAVFLLIKHWDTLKAAVAATGRFFKDPMARLERLGEILSNLGSTIKDKLLEAFNAIPGALVGLVGIIGRALGGAAEAVLGALASIGEAIVRNLPTLLGNALSAAFRGAFALLKVALRVQILAVLALMFGLPLLILKTLTVLGPKLVEAFTAAFNWLTEHWRGVVQVLLTVVLGLPGLIIAVLTSSDLRGKVLGFFTGIFSWIAEHWRGVVQALLVAVLGVPGLIIAALTNSDMRGRIFGFFSAAFSWIADHWSAIVQGLLLAVGGLPFLLFKVLTDGDFRDRVFAFFGEIPGFIGDALGGIGDTIADAFGDFGGVAGDVVSDFVEMFGELPGQIGDVLSDIPGVVIDALSKLPRLIGRGLTNGLRGLGDILVTAFNAGVQILVLEVIGVPFLIFKALQNFGPRIGSFFLDAFTTAFNFLRTNLPRLVGAVVSFLVGLPGSILRGWVNIGQMFLDAFGVAFTFLVTNLPIMAQAIFDFFAGLPERIAIGLVTLGEVIRGVFVSAWNALTSFLTQTAAPAVLNFFTRLPGRVVSALGSLARVIRSAFQTALDGARNVVSGAVDGIVRFFRDLPARILGLAGAIAGAARAVGTFLMQGLINGIRGIFSAAADFASAIADAVGNVMNGIIDRLNDAFDFTLKGPGPLPDLHVDLPDLPHFAMGGIFSSPTAGILGEAGKEVVIPLTKPKRALELARESGLLDVLAKARADQQTSFVVTFAEGSIVINPPPGMTPAEARRLGRAVADGAEERMAQRRLQLKSRTA